MLKKTCNVLATSALLLGLSACGINNDKDTALNDLNNDGALNVQNVNNSNDIIDRYKTRGNEFNTVNTRGNNTRRKYRYFCFVYEIFK